jgi:hypothetical protein
MTRHRGKGPHWMTLRWTNKCSRCNALIPKGGEAFYYPDTGTILCAGEDCGRQAARDLAANDFDEANCCM